MKKTFTIKHALYLNVIALLTSFAMLLSCTYAWFTDTVTSDVNRIEAGRFRVKAYHQTWVDGAPNDLLENSSDWQTIEDKTNLFKEALNNTTNGNNGTELQLWEPGAMAVESFQIKNEGELALKYQFNLVAAAFNQVTWDEDSTEGKYDLRDVIKVAIVDDATNYTSRDSFINDTSLQWMTWSEFVSGAYKTGALKPNATKGFTVAMYWPSTANDNYYNLFARGLGNYTLTNYGDATTGPNERLFIDVKTIINATQDTVEADSFGITYDDLAVNADAATYTVTASSDPVAISFSSGTSTNLTKTLTAKAGITKVATATVAAGTTLTLTNPTETKTSLDEGETVDLQLSVESTEDAGTLVIETRNGSKSYDVDMTAIVTKTGPGTDAPTKTEYKVASTEKVFIVDLYIGTVDLQNFYHNSDPMTGVGSKSEVDLNGEYYYDVTTGYVTFATTSFSPFTSVYKFAGGLGTEQYPYLIANRAQMQAISEEENYAYYKWNGASTMDCTNWTPIFLYGSFDGAGVKFENLDQPLFRYVYANDENNERDATVENFDIVDCNVISSSYYVAPVIHIVDVSKTVTLSNIDISGYAEAIIVSSFVGQSYAGTLNINDCKSTLTLVATEGQVSGFVGNGITLADWGAKYNPIYVKVTDSVYHGSMAGTGESGRYVHAHNNSDCKLSLTYTEAFLSSYNDGDLYPSFAETNASNANPISAGLSYGVAYKTLVKKTLTAPSVVGETITFTKDADAVTAVAGMVIGLNPGNGTGVYQKDTIDLNSVDAGANVSTTTVKKYNIAINNDGHSGTGAEGDTQYISSSYCNGTYNSYFAYVIQYDINGAITSVSTCDLK